MTILSNAVTPAVLPLFQPAFDVPTTVHGLLKAIPEACHEYAPTPDATHVGRRDLHLGESMLTFQQLSPLHLHLSVGEVTTYAL